MRKLLLLINVACFHCLMVSCQNSQQQKNESPNQSQPLASDSAMAIDTTAVLIQSELPKTVGMEPGINKDTMNQPTKGAAIIHSSPEQEKIDSIKKEKLKGKK